MGWGLFMVRVSKEDVGRPVVKRVHFLGGLAGLRMRRF
jgi:hypothetical protein